MTKMPAADSNTKKPWTQTVSASVLVLQQHAMCVAPFRTATVGLGPEVDRRPACTMGKVTEYCLSLSVFTKVCYLLGVGPSGSA